MKGTERESQYMDTWSVEEEERGVRRSKRRSKKSKESREHCGVIENTTVRRGLKGRIQRIEKKNEN